jgi:uncharacterized membrane protein YbhN (UPF0104 family)
VKNTWRGNNALRILPGLALSVAAILALVLLVDWRKTVEAWGRAQLWVLAPAAVCVVAAMVVRAVGWRFLMGNRPPLAKSFWVLNISYVLNGFLPFRLGDIGRAYLISRRADAAAVATPPTAEKALPSKIMAEAASPPNSATDDPSIITAGAALSAVALERVFDLVFTFILILTVFPLIAAGDWSNRMLLLTLGLAIVGFLGLLALGSLSGRILQAAEKAADRFPAVKPVLGPLGHFLTGLRQVRNWRSSLPAFVCIGAAILLWAVEYWVVLTGFFPGATPLWGLLSLVGGLIGVALPSSPSSLGVFEGAVTAVLTMAGMPVDTAVAYAIAIHVLNIILLNLLGGFSLWMERQSLGSILSAAQAAGTP